MAVSPALVKELRERTGAGMMDCKRALDASDGDIDAAIEAMRASGQAKAIKKAGRVAAEGIIVIKRGDGKASMLEVNCETDFVARDENFTAFANQTAELALSASANDAESLLSAAVGDETVEVARQNLVSKIGENVQLRRVSTISSSHQLASYAHGLKIGVLVEVEGGDADLAKDLAMHIAASKPEVVLPEQVSEERVAAEKRFLVEQARDSGKPEEIIEKMISGRLKKFLGEISLVGQAFVKDPSMTVADLLKQHNAAVHQFIRFEVGEGIEKEEGDFAEEVMAQVKGA